MRYDVAQVTHTGNKRAGNQDRVLVRTGQQAGHSAALLAVADGMGGLACGERASAIAAEALAAWWEQPAPEDLQAVSRALDAAIYEAHRQIYYLGESLRQPTGSTLSLVYLRDREYIIKQIGDSRVYELSGGAVRQLTVDQTWCNQKIQSGELTPEAASRHRLRHALVNALGVSAELQIETTFGAASAGTEFLLCSDGFYSEAPLAWLSGKYRREAPQATLNALLEAVLAGPAPDNASAVLCRLG